MNAVLEFEQVVAAVYSAYLDARSGLTLCRQKLDKMQETILRADSELTVEEIDRRKYIYGKGPPTDLNSVILHEATQGEYKARASKSGSSSQFIGNMALVAVYQYWEDHYRAAIAELFGVDKNDLKALVMNDLRLLRHSIIHRRGVADKRVERCKVLKWFREGESIFIDKEKYDEAMVHVSKLIGQYKERLGTESRQAVPTIGVRVMAVDYNNLSTKFNQAVSALIGGGTIQKRLCYAHMTLMQLRPQDMPEEIREAFLQLIETLASGTPVGDEGTSLAFCNELSNEEAKEWAEQIVYMYDRVTTHVEPLVDPLEPL